MKTPVRVFLSALALASFVLVPAAFGQSASGGFHVVTGDGNRNVEFNAKVLPNGNASGDLKFSGPVSIPDQDVDGDGSGGPSVTGGTLSVRVDVDCLKVDGKRAVLGGQIREASVSGFVGQRMLLTVEDSGEGKNAEPDRYTWGQYRNTTPTWVASDGELTLDTGVGLVWDVSDFERSDDPVSSSTKPTSVDCKSFPLSSYALEDLPQGSGNIQVKP